MEEMAASYSDQLGLPATDLCTYLREDISYEPDEKMQAGLQLFYELAQKHGIIQTLRPLVTVDCDRK